MITFHPSVKRFCTINRPTKQNNIEYLSLCLQPPAETRHKRRKRKWRFDGPSTCLERDKLASQRHCVLGQDTSVWANVVWRSEGLCLVKARHKSEPLLLHPLCVITKGCCPEQDVQDGLLWFEGEITDRLKRHLAVRQTPAVWTWDLSKSREISYMNAFKCVGFLLFHPMPRSRDLPGPDEPRRRKPKTSEAHSLFFFYIKAVTTADRKISFRPPPLEKFLERDSALNARERI